MEYLLVELKGILDYMDSHLLVDLENHLIEKAYQNGWIWARALFILNHILWQKPLSMIYDNLPSDNEFFIGKIHITEIFHKYLSYDNIKSKFHTPEDLIVLRCVPNTEEFSVQIMELYNKIEELKREDGKDFLDV